MTFLLLNQTFYPDVMATGQYLTEVAVRLVERGHGVTVVTSCRAYDHPETQFPKTEIWRGIRIYRVASTGFGKGAKWRRAADFASFLALCTLRLALLPRHDVVVALTSPPLISFLGAVVARVRRSRFFYWVMDFNPDEAIAAGWLRPDSLAARALDWMSRFSLRQSQKVIALDRFMRDRIVAKSIVPTKVVVIPPWSHDTEVKFDPAGRERFRKAHGFEGKFVIMYSGNHSPVHPLDTLLAAAQQLASDPEIVFCFVGGGSEWRKIKQLAESSKSAARIGDAEIRNANSESGIPSTTNAPLSTIHCLPYQPLGELSGSLSAADLHVVVMGNAFVGLVHPCKIYNVLSVGAPVLCIGPRPSHLSELLDAIQSEYPCASVAHGEIDRVVQYIQSIRRQPGLGSRQTPERVRTLFSKEALLPKLIAELESA
ncbi:MAG: glycosyltransferase family 4 protein [Verrucomicrobia bacterium]|nr:glycosyltransferase family 4 protein [Verrucomicrobiota bacterium]